MICVSKCLMGHNCRYDGKNMKNDAIIEYLKDKDLQLVYKYIYHLSRKKH